MNLSPICLACLVLQVKKAFNLLKPEAKNDEIVKAQKKLMEKMLKIKSNRMPYYGQAVYKHIAQELGNEDPYREIKKRYNKIALNLVPMLKKKIEKAENSLLTSIGISILGNTIDFGTNHKINLKKDIENFSFENLKINDYKDFLQDLKIANKILIIGDNTGECVFDKVMIEYLIKKFPKKEFIYVVRGGPAINDITMIEALEIGFPEICEIVETSASPGVILEQSSKKFLDVFNSADLILSKGQGNFESLDDIVISNAQIYFLLKAKCDFVADIFGVKLGSLIFYHRKNEH